MTKQYIIGFIGGGNMAQAMISGLLHGGHPSTCIWVSDPCNAVRTALANLGIHTTEDNTAIAEHVDVVILAIKPQLFEVVLSPLAGLLQNKLVISIAAGITIATIKRLIFNDNIVRCMPNTPALIQAGATGLYAHDNVTTEDKKTAENILAQTGIVTWVNREELIHAVTAVSGSAPAYFFHVMEIMITAAESMGLTKEQATQLTLHTAFGAAQMALYSDQTPATLRENVTSPAGTTQAALDSLQQNHFDSILAEAMQACAHRSQEMARDT